MIILCAVDREWNIGHQGELLFHIPQDLKRFQGLTEGNVIVMGRKTLDSLPLGRPLANRVNIVVSRRKDLAREGLIVVGDLEELEARLEDYRDRQVFLIGGGELISQLHSRCSQAYITRTDYQAEEADTRIPNLDLDPNWIIEEESTRRTYEGISYSYVNYRRID